MLNFVCEREYWNVLTKRLACEKFTWVREKRELIEQCWQGWVSKSRLGMDPRRGDWLSQLQMEDGAHRKRINCLISARWGTGLLLADRLLREGGRGGKKMGIEKENESRGNRQQMNLHLCSEAGRDSSKKTSQTTAEVQLWSHTSCGFTSPKEHLGTF